MPRRYPAEFRRKVLDLVAAGRPVAQVAYDLQISAQAIYTWRRQLIDSGQIPGITSSDHAELVAARRRIAELENELAIHRRAAELLGDVVLWVPRTSSTSRDQAIFVDQATGASLPSDAVLVEIELFGKRFQWRSAVQRPVRPVLIVVSLVFAQDSPQVALVPDEGAVQQLAPASPDPAFGDRVHARRRDVAEHGPDPGVGEDGVERGGEV